MSVGNAIKAGELAVNTTVTGISESVGDLEKLAYEIVKVGKDTKKTSASIAKYTKIISGLVAVNIVQRNFNTLWNMLQGTADRMDDLAKRAKRMGMEVGESTRLTTMAEMGGADGQSMEVALNAMVRNITNFRMGLGEAKAMLEGLGVSAQSFAGKNTQEMFLMVVDLINSFGSEAERAALRMKIFGESGNKIATVTNMGADGIQRMNEKLKNLGVGPEGSVVERFETFKDIVTLMEKKFVSITDQVATYLVPILTEAMISAIAYLETSSKWSSQMAGDLQEMFTMTGATASNMGVLATLSQAMASATSWVAATMNVLRTTLYGVVALFAKLSSYTKYITFGMSEVVNDFSEFMNQQSIQSFGMMVEETEAFGENLKDAFGVTRAIDEQQQQMATKTSEIRDTMAEIARISAEYKDSQLETVIAQKAAAEEEKKRQQRLNDMARKAKELERATNSISLSGAYGGVGVIRRGVAGEKAVQDVRQRHMEQYLKAIARNTANAAVVEGV